MYKRIKIQLISILICTMLIIFSPASHALPFIIETKVGTQLPTNVVVGKTATAYYTVQNNTLSLRHNNYVFSLPKNVTQVTNGGTYDNTCGATFNLAPAGQLGDQCTLQLTISGPVNPYPATPSLVVCFPGGTTCAGTVNQLNVTQTTVAELTSLTITPATTSIIYLGSTEQYTAIGAYTDNSTINLTASVTWHSSHPTIATIAATGLATGNTIGSTDISATLNGINSNASPLTIVSTPVITATLPVNAVPINDNFNIVFTQLGMGTNIVSATLPRDLTFVSATNCTVSDASPTCSLAVNAGNTVGSYTITPTLTSGIGIITSSPDPLIMTVTQPLFSYVSDFTNTLYQCQINPSNGSFLNHCIPLTNTGVSFSNTSGVAFNTSSSNQKYAYVGDSSSILWQCPLNTNGTFSAACTALTNPGTTFVSTRHTTFNTFAGSTYAYVSDDSPTLWQCLVNETGGFSGACTGLNNGMLPFEEVFNTTFYTMSGSTYAYVADHSFVLWRCLMNSTGGFNGPCVGLTQGSGPFTSTLSATFQTFNGTTYVYVADDSNILWSCPLNNDGTIEECVDLQNSTTPFYRTSSVSFNTFAGVTYAYVTDETNFLWQCPMNNLTGAFIGPCAALTDPSNFNDNAISSTFYVP